MKITISYKTNGTFSGVLRYIRGGTNLLDSVICPAIDRGCRYLRLANRDKLFVVADQAKVVADVEDWLSGGPVTGQAIVSKKGKRDPLRRVKGLDLRGRTLRFADFTESKLYKAILNDADLRGATLRKTWLLKSKLREARLQGADLSGARLQGAVLRSARLQGADLRGARLQGVDLRSARLQGANLSDAWLQGAVLFLTKLQGADLRSARLQGAVLRGASLQNANLHSARLQGADLRSARLQGAVLQAAQMQGADLRSARLQGADLQAARLQGADLRSARLQGADLRSAQLQGADLREVNVRSSLLSKADFQYADLRGIKRGPIWIGDILAQKEDLDRFNTDAKLRQRILATVNKRRVQPDDLEKADTKGAYCSDNNLRAQLTGCGDYASQDAYYKNVIAKVLRPMACEGTVNPAVARGLVRRTRPIVIRLRSGKRRVFVGYWRMWEALLDEKCAGRKHLSKQTIARFKDTVKRLKPNTPAGKK